MQVSEAGTDAACFRVLRELRDMPVVARFAVDGEPVSKARARFTGYGSKGRAFTPEKTKQAEEAVAWQYRASGARGLADAESAFGVVALFFCGTRQRRDVDNMLKLVLDGLNGVAWVDDSQVTEVSGRKQLVEREEARTEILVYRVGLIQRNTGRCEHCGDEFEAYRSQRGRRFCSQTCHLEFRRAQRTKQCRRCGKDFVPAHGDRAVYCSSDCRRSGHSTEVTCLRCGISFAKWASVSRQSKPLCSPECRAAYWRMHRPTRRGGTCIDCGGPTSKRTYSRCRGCATANRPAKTARGPVIEEH